MEMDAGTPPVASIVLSEKNLKEKHLKNALQGFLEQLKETLLKLKPPGVEAAKSGKTVSGGAKKFSASSAPETHR
jgi:hypothetical protein